MEAKGKEKSFIFFQAYAIDIFYSEKKKSQIFYNQDLYSSTVTNLYVNNLYELVVFKERWDNSPLSHWDKLEIFFIGLQLIENSIVQFFY